MSDDEYPNTVSEVISDSMRFKPSVLVAIMHFKAAEPYRGTLNERHQKFKTLHAALCAAYEITPPQLIFGTDLASCSGRSCYLLEMNAIILRGRLSVVTYLHEFAHARGLNERQAARWSLNLFRRCFPKSWSHATFEGHMIRRHN